MVACDDLDDKRPVVDIALPGRVLSHGDHGAVGLSPHRVIHASSDLDDVRPAADIALPVFVVSHGDHGAVGISHARPKPRTASKSMLAVAPS